MLTTAFLHDEFGIIYLQTSLCLSVLNGRPLCGKETHITKTKLMLHLAHGCLIYSFHKTNGTSKKTNIFRLIESLTCLKSQYTLRPVWLALSQSCSCGSSPEPRSTRQRLVWSLWKWISPIYISPLEL